MKSYVPLSKFRYSVKSKSAPLLLFSPFVDSSEVCFRCDRGVQGGGGTAESALSSFFFAMVMDRMIYGIRQADIWG